MEDDNHGDYTDPEKSGLRSGKGTSFLGSIVLNIEDKDMEKEDNRDNDNYTDPEESGLRSGKGTGFLYNLLFGD